MCVKNIIGDEELVDQLGLFTQELEQMQAFKPSEADLALAESILMKNSAMKPESDIVLWAARVMRIVPSKRQGIGVGGADVSPVWLLSVARQLAGYGPIHNQVRPVS